jgi:hypothetical protein
LQWLCLTNHHRIGEPMWGSKKLPPPPPPATLSSRDVALVTTALCCGLPLFILLIRGKPWTSEKTSKEAPIQKMAWRSLFATSVRKSARTFFGFVASFFALSIILRQVYGDAQVKGKNEMGAAGAEDGTRSLVADIVAFNVVSVYFAIYTSMVGLRAWFDGRAAAIGLTTWDRLYSHSPACERLCTMIAGYEFFNLLSVLAIPEYGSFSFISHHAITCLLGILGLYPYLHYYSIFFFGVASFSSIPLCFGEMFKAAGHAHLEDITKPFFALMVSVGEALQRPSLSLTPWNSRPVLTGHHVPTQFLAIRTAYWPFVSSGFWRDCLWALKDTRRVHSYGAFALMMLANVFLTGLQFYWTSRICAGIGEMLLAN